MVEFTKLRIERKGVIAALIGGLLMLILTIAGVIHIRRTPEDATI